MGSGNMEEGAITMKMARILVVAVVSGILAGCCSVPDGVVKGRGCPRYVFLFIGDGMGANQRLLAEIVQNGAKPPAVADYRQLQMNRFPVAGLVNTRSTDSWITDSAAAGTAIACGTKTANHVIAMDPGRTTRLDSIADCARGQGMRVGLATTVELDDATPSVFCAHASDRGKHQEIVRQQMTSPVEFLGGNTYGDSREIALESAVSSGRRIVTNVSEFQSFPAGGRVWVMPQAVEGDGSLPYALDRDGDSTVPGLAEITKAGIRQLEGPAGFFFMIEGGKCDWGCHANDAAAAVGEVLDLDRAIAVAVEFYNRHPGETLILVTADHETGGLALGRNETGYALHPEFISGQKCSAAGLTGKIKAWRAAGKGAEDVPGLLKAEWLDMGALSAEEEASLKAAYRQGHSFEAVQKDYGIDPLAAACIKLAARRAGLGWSSSAHTSAAVPVTAKGVGQDRFSSWMDNTELSTRLRGLISVKR